MKKVKASQTGPDFFADCPYCGRRIMVQLQNQRVFECPRCFRKYSVSLEVKK